MTSSTLTTANTGSRPRFGQNQPFILLLAGVILPGVIPLASWDLWSRDTIQKAHRILKIIAFIVICIYCLLAIVFSLLFISPILFLFLIIQIDIFLTQTLLLGYFFFATSGIPFIYWIFSRRNNPHKAGFAFRVSSIFALFNLCLISLVLLVVSLFTDEALHRILTGFFIQSFISVTPLLLPALGGLFSERSGVINIGLEGIMLSAAFLGVFGSWISQNPWVGLMIGVIFGGLIGLVYAILCIRFHADQIIVGVAVNLVALGVPNFSYKWSGDS